MRDTELTTSLCLFTPSGYSKAVIEGSQASQILEQVLDGGFDTAGSCSSNLRDHNHRKDTERDLSSDVTGSPQASRYQYFGLDATQTDTQLLDEDEVDEGLLRGNKRSFPVKAMKGVQEPTNAGLKNTRFQQVKDASPSKVSHVNGCFMRRDLTSLYRSSPPSAKRVLHPYPEPPPLPKKPIPTCLPIGILLGPAVVRTLRSTQILKIRSLGRLRTVLIQPLATLRALNS